MDIQDTELLTHNSFREVINLISIEKINNGYLVENIGGKRAFPGLDDLFDHLLLIFEGKITISTLLFFCLFSGESLGATGRNSP